MTVDDPARQALYARLTEVLGADHATTLMEVLLPPPGLDLATTADLEAMGERLLARLDERMDGLGGRMDRFEERMDRFEERMDRLEERMDRLEERMDRLEERMDRLERHQEKFDDRLHEFHFALGGQVRQFVIAQAGVLLSLAIIAFAAARLA